MRVNITDVESVLEDTTLDEAMYEVECIEADARDTKSGFPMLIMRIRISDGPTQMSGKSPIGEEATVFVVLDENAAGTPKGKELMRKRIGETFSAFGVAIDETDEHEFVGKRALAKIRPGEDGDGFPVNDVRRFKKLPA